jgi:hypothetical protein
VHTEIAAFRERTDERFEQARAELAAFRQSTDERFENMEHRLMARLGLLMAGGIAVIGTMVALF